MRAFSAGFGYGAGLMIGVCGGAVVVGATAVAVFLGYTYARKFFEKRKEAED